MNLSRARRSRPQEEKKINWVVVILAILVILMGYVAIRGRMGRSASSDSIGSSSQVDL